MKRCTFVTDGYVYAVLENINGFSFTSGALRVESALFSEKEYDITCACKENQKRFSHCCFI